MVAFRLDRAPRATGLLVLAIAAAPDRGFSQPAVEPGPAPRQFIEAVLEQLPDDAADPLELIESMKARGAFRSLEEAPPILEAIRNEEAEGNAEFAWHLEQELLALARRFPADVRAVAILRGAGDKRMEILGRYVAGAFPPQIVLGCYYGGGPPAGDILTASLGCRAGSRGEAIRALISDAQRHYAGAIFVLLRTERYSSRELRELELALVRASYAVRYYNDRHGFGVSFRPAPSTWEAVLRIANWEPPHLRGARASEHPESRRGEADRRSVPNHQFWLARLSLERLFAYDVAIAAPWPKQIEALIRIADWDLLYSRNKSALEGYELAQELLEEAGAPRAAVDRFFAPKTPVVIPAFLPNPLAADPDAETTGHIEVSFEISKYGKSRRIEIVHAAPGVSKAEEDGLVELIRRSRFRPRISRGGLARASVVVRYAVQERDMWSP